MGFGYRLSSPPSIVFSPSCQRLPLARFVGGILTGTHVRFRGLWARGVGGSVGGGVWSLRVFEPFRFGRSGVLGGFGWFENRVILSAMIQPSPSSEFILDRVAALQKLTCLSLLLAVASDSLPPVCQSYVAAPYLRDVSRHAYTL